MNAKKISSALISVFSKEGLDEIAELFHKNHVKIYSTGGTAAHIEKLGIPVTTVEDITGYPSILEGRVKTLHPAVFGGILARREKAHLETLSQYEIPSIDCVVVDLYPFEDTVKSGATDSEIIEKIDIGGISLIRAAAKNHRDVVVIPSKESYGELCSILKKSGPYFTDSERKKLALKAFALSSHYDTAIRDYFISEAGPESDDPTSPKTPLRYGENPHQNGYFQGNFDELFEKLNGKELSYNNLLDVDAIIGLMSEFDEQWPTVAVVKHNNSCGLATANHLPEAWKKALSGDPVSAFGGIICTNRKIDKETAEAIDQIFYEVLIAPDYDQDALQLLTKKKKRIVLKLKKFPSRPFVERSCLNGKLVQDADRVVHKAEDWKVATRKKAGHAQMKDILFANKVVKHLKSNAIALVKGEVLLGMGAGSTSRVDALRQAIKKAEDNGFDLYGAVMASDAFFPFKDCVEIAHEAGVQCVVQPGGSVKDQESIDFCDEHEMSMYMTGIRHFKH